jgi:hypothetical protein
VVVVEVAETQLVVLVVVVELEEVLAEYFMVGQLLAEQLFLAQLEQVEQVEQVESELLRKHKVHLVLLEELVEQHNLLD